MPKKKIPGCVFLLHFPRMKGPDFSSDQPQDEGYEIESIVYYCEAPTGTLLKCSLHLLHLHLIISFPDIFLAWPNRERRRPGK